MQNVTNKEESIFDFGIYILLIWDTKELTLNEKEVFQGMTEEGSNVIGKVGKKKEKDFQHLLSTMPEEGFNPRLIVVLHSKTYAA